MTPLEDIKLLDYHNGKEKWSIKKEAVELYEALEVHAEGKVPKKIIDARRPNEPDEIKQYRYDIYASKTEHPISKVLTSLTKIRRSPDYKVDYSKTEAPAFLDETLQKYLEQEYPVYDNIDAWLFDEAMQNALIDANAVVIMMPESFEIMENELVKPIPYICNCDDVLYYEEGDFVIACSDREIEVVEDGAKREYEIHILSTRNEIIEYYVTHEKKVVEINRFTHNLDELLAFRFRGLFYDNEDGDIIWKSPLQSMVVHLNEAAREYSDLQAEKVLHIYSEKWTINTNTCSKCSGTGKVKSPGFAGNYMSCGICKGSGYETVSPFKNHQINVDLTKPNQQIPPIPPAGYIQKDTAITKLLEESVNKHLYMALESVNMQFLYNVPLDQSGISKAWDRDETDNFAYKVASILKYIRENVAYYTNEMRYYFLIPSKEQRMMMLPTVTIPQKYDLVNNQLLIDEYKQAKEAKLSPVILANMEIEIALKRFSHDTDVSTYTTLVYKLDPLYTITEDEKILRLQNKGITEMDYVISSNIQKYVRKAIYEDANFPNLDYAEQVKVMEMMAEETMRGNSFSAAIAPDSNVSTMVATSQGNDLAMSVGGLTGMIEIVKAVASGVYDLEAAVSLVAQRFGITEEEARKQLGTPQTIQSEAQAAKVATLTQ